MLRILANFAEVRGDSGDAADLRRAAAAIEQMPPAAVANLENRVRKNEPSFGPTVQSHLREVILGSSATAISAAQAPLPSLLRGLLEGPAIASDEAASLVRQGILTLADLLAALDDEQIRKTAGEALDARLRPAAGTLELERVLRSRLDARGR